jgi:hypothetical protein
MRSGRDEAGNQGDDRSREIEVSTPLGVAASAPETIERDSEDHPVRKWAFMGLALVVVAASVFVSVVVPKQRADQLRRERASYDQLLVLSANAEASIERAVSKTRDVAQYAEPLLNSSLTSPATRATLYQQVRAAAAASRADIEAERQSLAAAPTPRRLRVARAATLEYLQQWSLLFARAANGSYPAAGSTDDLQAQHQAALDALQQAAPDPERAALASTVFGTFDS